MQFKIIVQNYDEIVKESTMEGESKELVFDALIHVLIMFAISFGEPIEYEKGAFTLNGKLLYDENAKFSPIWVFKNKKYTIVDF